MHGFVALEVEEEEDLPGSNPQEGEGRPDQSAKPGARGSPLLKNTPKHSWEKQNKCARTHCARTPSVWGGSWTPRITSKG